jgi:putative FmdB family regulatory protein
MPTYDYECDGCGDKFELYQSFSDSTKRKCKKCGEKKLRRLIGCGIDAFCNNVTTIGQMGERNAKKAGRCKAEELAAKSEDKKKKAQQLMGNDSGKRPWWRNTDKPLDLKKIKNVKKYIEEGKKE